VRIYAINTLTENPFAPSGAQGYYAQLIGEMKSELDANEILYVICSRSNRIVFESSFNERVRPIVFPYSNERRLLRVLTEHSAFPAMVRRFDIDVYNCGNLAPLWLPQDCRVVSTNKTMHAFTEPDSMSVLKRRYRVALGSHTAIRASLIISNSDSNTRDILKFLPVRPERIRKVYEAVDHRVFFPQDDSGIHRKYLAKFGIGGPFILFVSSLYKYKNAETLIRAFANLSLRYEYQLVIVGYPRETDYHVFLGKLINELGLQQRVVLVGGVPLAETARFYQSAAVFVYPSYYETFGLTIIEAMACGSPVITSNTSSMPEIGGDAALYFNPRDDRELTALLELILQSPGERQKRRSLGIDRAKQFTWKKTAQETLAVFREAAELKS
jgi:glycosyltransferase involved in cell wall biosynthesis